MVEFRYDNLQCLYDGNDLCPLLDPFFLKMPEESHSSKKHPVMPVQSRIFVISITALEAPPEARVPRKIEASLMRTRHSLEYLADTDQVS